MSAHTEGPWAIERNSLRVKGANGKTVADCRYTNGRHDARLISTAPELLEALESFVDTGFVGGPQLKRAKAAIAKATGAA